MNDNIIKILITAKDDASSVLAGVKAAAGEAANASKQFAVGLAATAAATAAFVGYGAKIAGDLEASRAGFITLLGSADKADAALAQIKKDAASTPFELPGLISANQLLTSVTKDAGRSETMLMSVGKALSAMGKGQPELDRIIVNLQQVGAVGKATMMDVKQFAFAGIPIFEMLSQATGKTGDALSQFISDGGVTFDMLEGMFNKAGDAGGRFADAFTNQAGGFNQVLSNLQDTVNMTMADIIKDSGVFDLLKGAMKGVGDWISGNKDKIANGIKGMFRFIKDNGVVIAGIIMGALLPGLVSLAAGVWAVVAPLLPFMAIGAGVALLLQMLADKMGGWGNVMAAVQPILAQIGNFISTVFVQAWNTLLQVWQFLQPSLVALWGNLQQLWGSLMNLWNVLAPVLIPVLQTLAVIVGALIVGAIWVLINVINVLVQWWTFLYNTVAAIFSAIFAVISGVINAVIAVFNVWWGIVSYIMAVIRGIFLAVWGVIGGTVTNVMNGIVSTVRSAIDGVVGFFGGIWGRISGAISGVYNGVKNGLSGMFSGIGDGFKSAVNWVIDGLNTAIDGLNNSVGKLPGVPHIGHIARLYTGGQITQGGYAMVGEHGAEAVLLPQGAQVVSNRNTQAALANGSLGGGGGEVSININYNGRGQFSQGDAVDMAKQIRDALRAQGLDMTQLGALRG